MKVTRIGQAIAGRVEKLAATYVLRVQPDSGQPVYSNLAVTAARNGEGNLHLAVWGVANDGTPTMKSERIEGAISEVSVTSVADNRVVAAMRDDTGKLRLIAYQISNNGAKLTRLGTAVGGKIETVKVSQFVKTGESSVITVSRLPSAEVGISFWRLGDDGEFETPVNMKRGKATNLDVGAGSQGSLVGVRTEGGLLRLRAIRGVGFAGGGATGPKIFQVSIDSDLVSWYVGTINEPNATVRTGPGGASGRLILDTGTMQISRWDFERDDLRSNLVRVAHGELDGIGAIAWEIKVLAYGTIVVTVLSGVDTFEKLLPKDQGKPKMRVVIWNSRNGQLVKATHGVSGGKHTQISLARLADTPPVTTSSARFLIAARDEKGKLKLAVWKVTE
jgi:hypothetical protein